jgi:hypothetical protein
MKPITQKEVQDLFYYIDGKLIWKTGRFAGKKAGNVEKYLGYIRIGHNNQKYYEHELVWIFCHGYKIPFPNVTDHIDRNRANNNIGNLREASRRQNYFNVEKYDDVE